MAVKFARFWISSLCLGASLAAHAGPEFKFSTEEAKDAQNRQQEAAAKAESVQKLVSVPCRQQLKNRKILLLIAEQNSTDQWDADQTRYVSLFHIIDSRLKALGLRTYTQEQIRAQVAQAEVEAYFKNDPDAALAASRKLGADYLIKGEITSRSGVNPVTRIDEVSVNIELTLESAQGRTLSEVEAHADSYSGSDTMRTAAAIVREHADELVAQLYNDYCGKAGGGGRAKPAGKSAAQVTAPTAAPAAAAPDTPAADEPAAANE